MWLADINNSISKLEKNGTSHDAAVAESLLESVFVSNVDLYLKLTNASVDADHCEKIQDQMNIMCSVKEEQVKEQERIQAIEAENNQLHEQLDCLRHKNAEFEEKVQILEQEKKLLQTSLSEAQNKCSITSNAQSDDRLSKYDDRNPSVLHYIGSEETVSLCEITTDYNGQKWLTRHADLKNNEYYAAFSRNSNMPAYFENRDRIFYTDGPDNDSFYGIWVWHCHPNEKDPSKDYVESKYNLFIIPIEVIILLEVSDMDSLINTLKEGVQYTPHAKKVMFAFYRNNRQYTAVLADIRQLNIQQKRTCIDEQCIELPVYQFAYDDLTHLKNGLFFCKYVFAGVPFDVYPLKTPLEIVKDLVLSSVS